MFCDFYKICKITYFVEYLRTAASEKQLMNYRFNIKCGVLKNLLIIYPKNDKQNSNKTVQPF